MLSHLLLRIPGRRNARLGVPDLFQHTPRVLQVLRKQILLLRNLGEQDSELVRDVAHGLILGALAPFAQLRRDALALAAGLLVGADGMVFRLDQRAQLLGELGLVQTAERGEGELVLRGGGLGFGFVRADGVGASDVPGERC